MKYLLDTHAFLWSVFESKRLSPNIRSILLDPVNTVLVSLITFWEISLKYSLGKLELHDITPDVLPTIAKETGFEIFSLSEHDVASFHNLPKREHNDPFDRLLVWQSINNDITLISKDDALSVYKGNGLHVIW